MSNKDKKYPSEKKVFKDKKTSREIWQITDFPCQHNKLYITTNSWTPDGKYIIFLGQRGTNIWNLFKVAMSSGEITQLTDEKAHINPYNPDISSDGNWVWYHTGTGEIKGVHIETLEEKVIANIPEGSWSSTIAETPDGKNIIGRVNYHKNLLQPDYMENYELNRTITIISLDGKETPQQVMQEEFPFGHVLPPNKDGVIVYSKYDQGELWRIDSDGKNKRRLYGHYHDIWITHPVWLNNDEVLFNEWPKAMKKISLDGKVETITEFNAFHPAVSPDKNTVVCDTTHPDTGIYLVDIKKKKKELLCLDECVSIGGGQWGEERPYPVVHHYPWHVPSTHCHPSFNRNGTQVLFNSNRGSEYMQLFVVII
ncbi:MAG: hypothetical protein A2096_11980 [Spirochaetes bacterium GWF1_41_5]|nr:MAG: hypothetical protein A2096_11980 [Spirochaetes bacterium GWF1_41_5]HBE01012.1 hypothetical protein [Spirochaetia bacterium]